MVKPTLRAPLRTGLGLIALGVVLALALLLYQSRQDIAFFFGRLTAHDDLWFAQNGLGPAGLRHVFDIAIADVDGDASLDIVTSNHNYRQQLLLADEAGGYREALSAWGLDQVSQVPGWEQAASAPPTPRDGLYLYWQGDLLSLSAVGTGRMPAASMTLQLVGRVDVVGADGFEVERSTTALEGTWIPMTRVHIRAAADGTLRLLPASRGVPIQVEVGPQFPLDRVYLGAHSTSPASATFALGLRDRHGHAWADVDGDGRLDVFISRGGVGGTIRLLPAAVRDSIHDELLLTGGTSGFAEVSSAVGIEKKDCSGRHARWVDFDGDGRLDLFVNCQNRGKAEGQFPKQLWRQGADGRFEDVAERVGLGLADGEIIDFAWIDVDDDGDLDLVTSEDRGFYLYRNVAGRFGAEFVGKPDFARADVTGLRSEVNYYWRFDGKLSVADFDGDRDLDLFSSSKQGNVLLINDGYGRLALEDPAARGLPRQSVNATWVDYDSDGGVDLHVVPDGLFRNDGSGHFERTGLLAEMPHLYQAAIVHWFDSDNDGRRDVLIALNENPSLRRWWQRWGDDGDVHRWHWSLRRHVGPSQNWLQVELLGGPGNRQGIGARVSVTAAGRTQVQDVGASDSSFFSQGHYRLYFGLGGTDRIERIAVRWSDGVVQELGPSEAGRLLRISRRPTVAQGSGD
jgi:hypothetical protein